MLGQTTYAWADNICLGRKHMYKYTTNVWFGNMQGQATSVAITVTLRHATNHLQKFIVVDR
jgi:hypothetical protein